MTFAGSPAADSSTIIHSRAVVVGSGALPNNHVAIGDTNAASSNAYLAYVRMTSSGFAAASIPGDVDHDGFVNTADFTALAGDFNETTTADWTFGDITADFNHDGIINALDFNALAANFGAAPITPAPGLGALVPEPGCASLITLVCGIGALRRRRGSV